MHLQANGAVCKFTKPPHSSDIQHTVDKEDVRKVSAVNVQEGVPLSLPSLAEAILGDECARISYLRLIKSFPEIEIKSVLAEDKSIVTFLNRVRCI